MKLFLSKKIIGFLEKNYFQGNVPDWIIENVPISTEPIFRAEVYKFKGQLLERKQELVMSGVDFNHTRMVATSQTHVIFLIHQANIVQQLNGLCVDEVVFAYRPSKMEAEIAEQRTAKNKGKVYDGLHKIFDWNEQPLPHETRAKQKEEADD